MRDKYKGQIVLSREQVSSFDQWAINTLGIPELVLMENAGGSAARIFMQRHPKEASAVILCGTGNNGGDGFVVARHMLNEGYDVEVVILGSPERLSSAAHSNLKTLEVLLEDISFIGICSENWLEKISEKISKSALIVDALLGTGFKGPLREGYAELVGLINESPQTVFSIDLPSGLDADLGVLDSPVIKADCCVSFVALKKGLISESAQDYTGDICIASIGVDARFRYR